MRELNWAEFKQLLTEGQTYTYIQKTDCLEVYAQKIGLQFFTQLPNGSAEQQDFLANYAAGAS